MLAPLQSQPDAWELNKEITALRKGGDVTAAIALAEEALEQLPDSEPIRSAFAWALYDRDIKSLPEDADLNATRRGWRTCEKLRELLSEDLYSQYSAWVPAVLRVSARMLSLDNADRTRRLTTVSKMLTEVDGDKLSTERFQDRPSPMERHALQLTKALYSLAEWEELKHVCQSALLRLSGCPDTELWLHNRLGLALLELNEPQTARTHLTKVLSRKNAEWWAHRNVGRAHAACGDSKEATKAFATALLGGQLQMKTAVMVGLAHELRSAGDVELADRHHRVARQIRLDNNWHSTPEIDAPLDVSTSESAPDDLSRLEACWKELSAVPREEGVVQKVLDNGGAGFLSLDRGDRVYFAMPRDVAAPPEGMRVTCRVVPSFDKKQQRESTKAVDVQPLAS